MELHKYKYVNPTLFFFVINPFNSSNWNHLEEERIENCLPALTDGKKEALESYMYIPNICKRKSKNDNFWFVFSTISQLWKNLQIRKHHRCCNIPERVKLMLIFNKLNFSPILSLSSIQEERFPYQQDRAASSRINPEFRNFNTHIL